VSQSRDEKFNWKDVNSFPSERGVNLISSGLDEVPMAYKKIGEVMDAQCVPKMVLGQFDHQAGEDVARRRVSGGFKLIILLQGRGCIQGERRRIPVTQRFFKKCIAHQIAFASLCVPFA